MSKPIFNRVYDREYFSGTQAALYIGDVFIDEISSFAFTGTQVKTPIYGYASQLFDATSAGPFIVQGNFSINYKETSYLYLVLMRYFEFVKGVNAALLKATGSQVSVDKFIKSIGVNTRVKDMEVVPTPFSSTDKKIIRQGIEGLIQNNLSTGQKYQFFQDLSGFASSVGLDTNFEDIAEVLEDQVWGDRSQKDLDKVVRRTDDNFFDGFDMYFTYGDFNNPKANHTVERITGVRLTGRSKAVSVSGEPIQEEYQFIGRNHY